jgi:hypothetical protein
MCDTTDITSTPFVIKKEGPGALEMAVRLAYLASQQYSLNKTLSFISSPNHVKKIIFALSSYFISF